MLTFIYSRLQLVAFVEFSVYGPLLFMIHATFRGAEWFRSHYLSHAKRALYHLSYNTPNMK